MPGQFRRRRALGRIAAVDSTRRSYLDNRIAGMAEGTPRDASPHGGPAPNEKKCTRQKQEILTQEEERKRQEEEL